MNAQEIRRAYLKFYKDRDHVVIPRALLVPQNDPSTLFTGSGMQPLVPYLLGEEHPEGSRITDSQTCLRAQDIEEVGDNRHTTFFEMLGNWSLGDYFKKEQLPWFFEFLTDVVGLEPGKIYVTCFIGNDDFKIPKDTESAEIWSKLFKEKGIEAKQVEIGSEEDGYKKGMDGGRIFYYNASKNWWCRAGKISQMPVGEPGGPDSEVFYEFDFIEHDTKWGEHCHPNCDCGRFMEIGNSVFMEYIKTENGFEKLPKQNVDFGGGLERIAAARINSADVFNISVIKPIIEVLEKLSKKSYESSTESMRVIADHLRAATFLAVDGVVPSNKEQGYVMRRLMRRAIRFAFDLGVEHDFIGEVIPVIVDLYKDDFAEIESREKDIVDTLVREEKVFRKTLSRGLKELQKMLSRDSSRKFSASDAFTLQDTYGFPLDLTKEEVWKLGVDLEDDFNDKFEELLKAQKERSRTAGKGVFKGGLADHSEIVTKYHTATHLMYKALRIVLGDHVEQRGSNITAERIRFDFNNPEKVTLEQLSRVEQIVNEQITLDIPVTWKEMPTKEALATGARGHFGEKYGDTVKVYIMGDESNPYTMELCGGPHVEHAGVLGEGGKKFKIQKEESSSAGIRRIKAVLI